MLTWASFWRQLGGNFHTDPATLPRSSSKMAGYTVGYRLRRPKLTSVSLISMAWLVGVEFNAPLDTV